MPAPRKTELLDDIRATLKERSNFIVTTYSGLSVDKMTDLRKRVRGKNARMKVMKNNLFRIALKESPAHKDIADQVAKDLFGPVAVTFTDEKDFPAVSKVLVDYGKEADKVAIRVGSMDGKYLPKSEVQAIANLPSREELLTIIGRGLNAPATKIATGINQIIASLARGIKAVGEKNGG